jgi:hypothetical protein
MPTGYILWDRKEKTIVSSSGANLVFSASADATKHAADSPACRGNTYDVLSVAVA